MTTPKHNTPSPHPRRPNRDLSSQPFGRLVANYYVGGSRWECLCECGTTIIVSTRSLTSGNTTSCGCFKREYFATNNPSLTHGLRKHPIYTRWFNMLQRCYNLKNPKFKYYGGRGITVCERWRQSVENFYADMGDPPPGMTLERRDVNQGYTQENCYWASQTQQTRNRRTAHMLTYNGETHGITTWAEKLADTLNLNKKALDRRLRTGWSVEEALTTPRLHHWQYRKGKEAS